MPLICEDINSGTDSGWITTDQLCDNSQNIQHIMTAYLTGRPHCKVCIYILGIRKVISESCNNLSTAIHKFLEGLQHFKILV